ncbi:MAG TPA: hypothetical protein DEA90_03490, partial [Opitutae bacterium]|nr:hypothetical protein [Opitutae bacterium]
ANKNGQSRMALTQESVVVATLVAIRFKRLQGAIWQLKQPLRMELPVSRIYSLVSNHSLVFLA